MEAIIETGDAVTVIAEPGALVFATRKTWEPLPETRMDDLSGYSIIAAFKGTSSVFFLLHELAAPGFDNKLEDQYKLIKVTQDEDDKLVLYSMKLSAAESDQLRKNQLTLWD